MSTISEHLSTLSLSQYLPRFSSEGITSVAQLLPLSEPELDGKLASMGMLKGHAIKFRLSLDVIRSKNPANPSRPSAISPAKSQIRPTIARQPNMEENPLMVETQKITAKLVEIDSLKTAIGNSKNAILKLDVEGYYKVLEEIEELQRSLREQEDTGELQGSSE